MKLDEALQHRWAGVDIRRKAWHPTIANLDHDIIRSQGIGTDDLDADDWEVVPKYVGWDEAWKATKQGKAFISDYYNMENRRMERREFRLNKTTHVLEYRENKFQCWRKYDSRAPLHWLDATNFEILED